MISISSGDYSLDVLPELGGAVGALRFRSVDILRPGSPQATDPLEAAAFPLIPFANRIAHGAFEFDGTAVRLKKTAPGQPHALHGQGWRQPWGVQEGQSDRIALSFEHRAGEWPWHYAARQEISLDGEGLEVLLSVENRSERPMPIGLGWHPYFRRSHRLRLRAHVEGVWLTDEECLPTQRIEGAHFGDWSRGGRLPNALIDHCHAGWNGTAEIEWPEEMLCLRLSASQPLRWLHLYAPPAEDFFCIEPVSHMPDALNRPEPREATGNRTLACGETLAARVRLTAVPLKVAT